LTRITKTLGRSMQEKVDTPVSALWIAAHSGDRCTISRLVAESVDVNDWDKWGRTALLFAASTGRLDIVRDLVRAGACVDPHEDYDVYDSPLMHAAMRGDRAIVLFLLGEGADPTRHVGVSQQTAANFARLDYPQDRNFIRRGRRCKTCLTTHRTQCLPRRSSRWAGAAPSLARISSTLGKPAE
jgi:hypothetical protein